MKIDRWLMIRVVPPIVKLLETFIYFIPRFWRHRVHVRPLPVPTTVSVIILFFPIFTCSRCVIHSVSEHIMNGMFLFPAWSFTNSCVAPMADIRVLTRNAGGIDQGLARGSIEAALGRHPAVNVAANYIWVLMWVPILFFNVSSMGANGDQGRLSSKLPGPTATLLRPRIPPGWACVQDHAHLLRYREPLLPERSGAIWEEVWEYGGPVVGVCESWVCEISFNECLYSLICFPGDVKSNI
jgi:hypothetical protein